MGLFAAYYAYSLFKQGQAKSSTHPPLQFQMNTRTAIRLLADHIRVGGKARRDTSRTEPHIHYPCQRGLAKLI